MTDSVSVVNYVQQIYQMNAQNKKKELMNFTEHKMKDYIQLTDEDIQRNKSEKILQKNKQ